MSKKLLFLFSFLLFIYQGRTQTTPILTDTSGLIVRICQGNESVPAGTPNIDGMHFVCAYRQRGGGLLRYEVVSYEILLLRPDDSEVSVQVEGRLLTPKAKRIIILSKGDKANEDLFFNKVIVKDPQGRIFRLPGTYAITY